MSVFLFELFSKRSFEGSPQRSGGNPGSFREIKLFICQGERNWDHRSVAEVTPIYSRDETFHFHPEVSGGA